MKRHLLGAWLVVVAAATWSAQALLAQNPPAQNQVAQNPPNEDAYYKLGPDSLVQEGVPQGKLEGRSTLPSQAYPGTQHTYWVYVPAQYDPAKAASLMIFQDGQAFMRSEGFAAGTERAEQLDLSARDAGDDGVFINPGRRPDQPEPTPQELGGPRYESADGIQLARRQVCPRDLR